MSSLNVFYAVFSCIYHQPEADSDVISGSISEEVEEEEEEEEEEQK